MKQVDIVIIGCSAVGLGLALCCDQDYVIIESSASILPEWAQTYNPGTDWATYEADSPLCQQVQAEMVKRSILTKRGVHVTGLAALMAKISHESEVNVSFLTQVVGVETSADGFIVHIFNADGHTSLSCRRIIDTTSRCKSDPGREVQVHHRYLSFYLRKNPNINETQKTKSDDQCFVYGAFENEASMLLELNLQDDWSQIRLRAHEFWLRRSAFLRQWNCVAISNELFEVVEAVDTGSDDWLHIPATSVANALMGIDQGVSLAHQGALL